jgi:hypothetical protein
MRTELTTSSQKITSPPAAPVLHALLAESCPLKDTTSAENLDSHQLNVRATTVGVLLEEMLSEHGYRHDGINE